MGLLEKFTRKVNQAKEKATRQTRRLEETEEEAKEKWNDAKKIVAETEHEAAKIAADSDAAMDATNMFTVKVAKRQVSRISRRLKDLKKQEVKRRKAYYRTKRKTAKAERKVSRATNDFIRTIRQQKDEDISRLKREDAIAQRQMKHPS